MNGNPTAEVPSRVRPIGYGANVAFSADIQQNAGAGTKRTGTSPFVGAPVTNPLPPHPHPGLGNPSVLAGLFQLNGHTPNANGCAGDSGGPAIRNFDGQERTWGVGSWTGDFCEEFAYYTRLDRQRALRHEQPVRRRHDEPAPESVPTRQPPVRLRDELQRRTDAFLAPVGSEQPDDDACAQSCDAQIAACPGSQSLEGCTQVCRSWQTDVGICVQEFSNMQTCFGTQGTSSFTCDPDFGPFPNPGVCQAQARSPGLCASTWLS